MTDQSVSHQEPTLEAATLSIAETLSDVANKLTSDLDLVAEVCASHDQALLALTAEVERMRIANAQLFIRIKQIERKEQNHG